MNTTIEVSLAQPNDVLSAGTASATSRHEVGLENALSSTIPPLHAVELEDVTPDGGYGWICTMCVFLINANTWGVNSAWGIFLAKYLSDSSFPEASQLEYALIGGLSVRSSREICSEDSVVLAP